MPSFPVQTPHHSYDAIVERGVAGRISDFLPAKHGKVFVVTTKDVWDLHGACFRQIPHNVIFFPGGEARTRLSEEETIAEQMLPSGADGSSIVVVCVGGIVNDTGGFLAAIFMRGIPVIQIPTTLLAQVDAAVGGKTGVNLVSGKNLIGSFHQPLAVIIDPGVLDTLPEREYRAGLFEIVKHGVIRDPELFNVLDRCVASVLRQEPTVL